MGAVLFLAQAGCGLTESEAIGVVDPTFLNCPKPSPIMIEDAPEKAQLVLHAKPTESFFVDNCHRAFLLETVSAWQGELPDPVLAILRVEPYEHAERSADLGISDTAVFLLEKDPDIPDAFRPIGEGAVIPVRKGLAYLCGTHSSFDCEAEPMEIEALQAIFQDYKIDDSLKNENIGQVDDEDALLEFLPENYDEMTEPDELESSSHESVEEENRGSHLIHEKETIEIEMNDGGFDFD